MKRIWNILRGKARRDDRGMTFVEVLCAIAILALVSSVIGTVIVVSTRTYRKGISETGIQQEAQLAANNIGNIVKDACSVVYGESGQQYIKNGSDPMVNSDTTPKMQVTGFTELSIITNEEIQYTMTYDEAQQMLTYQELSTVDGSSLTGVEVMANNIVDFSADTTDFKKSKTIKLRMTVEDHSTNRKIPMEYTMTSRNDAVEGVVYVSSTDNVGILFPEGDIVLVPGETYQIPLVVAGKLTEGALEWESTGGLTPGALTLDYAEVTVPIGTTARTETIVVHTKDKDEEGNYKATASCNVLIRKVESVNVSHTTDTKNATGGMFETAGTVYTFNASVTGNELAKRVAYDYDRNYKTAQSVAWSCVLKIGSTETRYDWTCTQNAAGKWEFTAPDYGTGAFATYFQVDTAATKEDALVPSFVIKVIKTMPANLELTVRATSKHALGVNKADSAYGDKDNVIYYGEDIIKPRATTLKQGLEITLEPHETGPVAVGMKGGLTNDVTFEYHNATDVRTDANPNGTNAVYNEANDTVEITLGKNEKGSGAVSTGDPYTFTIDVKVSGEVKTTITVHVCRIDALSIELQDNFTDKKGGVMGLPTYDFRARFNVSNASLSDMQRVIPYLIQYKPDGTVDSDAVKKTLSSRITWELINHSANGGAKVEFKDSVVCIAGVGAGNNGEVGSYTKTYKKDGKEFYNVVNVKPARIEQDADGKWFIKQLPEIDISPSADTATGLPKDYELKITIEALHPLGTSDGKDYNKTGKAYGEAKDSISIKGDLTIDTPTQLVIVEPGQGTNDTGASDQEMVIPLTVSGVAVYKMEAAISENTSSDTRLSTYDKGNPYKAGNATSAGNGRIWYLGLWIGENEMGNSDGRIKVHIDGYNSQGKVIAFTDLELGVRRVDNVDVRVEGGKKISTINKEGSTMTLEAFPKGRGNNGTEFYDIQKDDAGNVYRWETEGHGKYIEPSPMEWKMLIKGVEKPLSEWTEYFEADSIKTSINESDHKATVTFKLKKAIPFGTKIRAYSLHARGMVGDTKYNKSEKKYGDIFGELEILDDGFQRADEFVFVDKIADMRQGFTDSMYDSEQRSFYRYRIKNSGTWTPYYLLEDNSEHMARFVGTKESLVFMPEEDYDLDIINVVYSRSKKLIYWPLDETLLEDGKGWKEEGFRLWNGDEIMKVSNYSGDYKQQMIDKEHKLYEEIKNSKEQWQWIFDVPKVNINFEIGDRRPWNVKDTSVTLANMSEASALHLQGSTQNAWTPGDSLAVKLAPTSFCIWKKQYHMDVLIDQNVGGQWKEVGAGASNYQGPGWFIQTSCPQFEMYNIYSTAQGNYRIRTIIRNMEWMEVKGRLFDREYVGFNRDTPLYDLSNSDGILYVKFN